MPKAKEMLLRCFLATESVSGTHFWDLGRRRSGSLEASVKFLVMSLRAAIGHRGEGVNMGSGMV